MYNILLKSELIWVFYSLFLVPIYFTAWCTEVDWFCDSDEDKKTDHMATFVC